MSLPRRVIALAMVVTLVLLCEQSSRSLEARMRQSDSGGISPEEAAIVLKPFELTRADLPAGFDAGTTTAITPAVEAVKKAATGADPYALLASSQAEGTQVCSTQDLIPAAGSAVNRGTLQSCVMASADAAQAVAAGTARALEASSDRINVSPASITQSLGDGATGAWQITTTNAEGKTTTEYDVRWTRGIVAFELRATAAPAQPDVTATASLSASLDTAQATRAPAALGAATVTPPATEAQRVYTALLEQGAFVPTSQPPAPTSTLFLSDIVHPADTVRAAANPQAALRTVDQVYQRIITADEIFRTRDRIQVHGQRITVSATARGALAELNTAGSRRPSFRVDDHDVALPGGQISYEAIATPIQLGDSTNAYKITVSYPNAPSEISYSIGWTHGRVFLQARYGAPANRNPQLDPVVPYARQVEAAFLASDLANQTADLTDNSQNAAALRATLRPSNVEAVLPPTLPGRARRAARWRSVARAA